jgi:YgiT-type zinc finger domain-containing protein
MKKCHECGGALKKEVRDHLYVESGLDDVLLLGVPHYKCSACGHESVTVPAMSKLHRAIAMCLAEKPYRLVPQEVRYLRQYLGLTNKRFAELMGVSAEQSSRWMSSDPVGLPAEHLLRCYATLGPEAFEHEDGTPTAVLSEVVHVIRSLSKIQGRQGAMPLTLAPSTRGEWKVAAPPS